MGGRGTLSSLFVYPAGGYRRRRRSKHRTHTIAFSRFVGPGGRVLSIDGQGRAFALLTLNTFLNAAENVRCGKRSSGRNASCAWCRRKMQRLATSPAFPLHLLNRPLRLIDLASNLCSPSRSLPSTSFICRDAEINEFIRERTDELAQSKSVFVCQARVQLRLSARSRYRSVNGSRFTIVPLAPCCWINLATRPVQPVW